MAVNGHIPIKVTSVANARVNWRTRALHARQHRRACHVIMHGALAEYRSQLASGEPCTVVITLTRVGLGRLDTDNLASACKAARDGVADALGVDDGDPRLRWRYEQVRGPWGLRVHVDKLPPLADEEALATPG